MQKATSSTTSYVRRRLPVNLSSTTETSAQCRSSEDSKVCMDKGQCNNKFYAIIRQKKAASTSSQLQKRVKEPGMYGQRAVQQQGQRHHSSRGYSQVRPKDTKKAISRKLTVRQKKLLKFVNLKKNLKRTRSKTSGSPVQLICRDSKKYPTSRKSSQVQYV